MDTSSRITVLLFTLLASGLLSGQTTWYVDSAAAPGGTGSAGQPFRRITDGIMFAAPTDQIVVAPGMYVENLDFRGKDVIVRAAEGPHRTIIDGGGAAPVVVLSSGESIAAVLEGFTVTGGRGPTGIPTGGFSGFSAGPGGGGGVSIAPGSGLTIRRCIITGNRGGDGSAGVVAPFSISAPGGAGGAGGIDGGAIIECCLVQGNTGGNGGIGGSNTFIAFGTSGGPGGAGGVASALILKTSTVEGNTGGRGGDAGVAGMGSTMPTETGGRGGTGGVAGVPEVIACRITGNHGGGGGFSAPPFAHGGDGDLTGGAVRCIGTELSRNMPGLAASAAALTQRAAGAGTVGDGSRFVNVTIGGNGAVPATVSDRVGGLRSSAGSCTITNGILWANEGASLGGPWTVTTSIVEGGHPGTGVLDIDPRWVDLSRGDLHLAADSPARDAGDNAAVPQLPAVDLDDEPRVGNGVVDLGADEFFLHLQVQQATPGAQVTVLHGNLVVGGEYFNVFMPPCPTGSGGGVFLGLCLSDLNVFLLQILQPLGAVPFHYAAAGDVAMHGPFSIPPTDLEAVLFRWASGRIDAVSPVTSLSIR